MTKHEHTKEADGRPFERPVGRAVPERDDRELLEKAAVAAGIEGRYFDGSSAIHTGIYRANHRYYWNPMASDSEAFRLAAALNFDVCINICFVEVVWVDLERSETFYVSEDWGAAEVDLGDRMERIRRAIVRMAAKVADHKTPNAKLSGAAGLPDDYA